MLRLRQNHEEEMMKTLSLSPSRMCLYAGFHWLFARTRWLQLNRLLAWAIVFAPILEMGLNFYWIQKWQVNFLLGWVFFVLHAVLSLILFGIPKLRGKKFRAGMHVFGLRVDGISPRNTFLLGAYRFVLWFVWGIFLAAVWYVLFLLSMPQAILISLALILAIVQFLAFVVISFQHLFAAIAYAVQRWGWPQDVGNVLLVLYYLQIVLALSIGRA